MREAEQDWRQWLARHGPAALLYARQITGNHQDAEDAVHDGFLRFWRAGPGGGVGLFFSAVRSAALDQRRSAGRRKRRERSSGGHMPLFEAAIEGMVRQEEVERALAELPEVQREIVVLKIWGGLTLAEVAKSLGESPNTVGARYRSAMERLQGLLATKVEHE